MKRWRFLTIFILGICLLSGCRKQMPEATAPSTQIVKKISASYVLGKLQLQRSYIQDEKIRTMLMFLRLLKREQGTQIDPERLDGSAGQITVEYADGRRNVYYLRADSFLSFNGHKWQKIDSTQGQWLRPLLESMPSDEI